MDNHQPTIAIIGGGVAGATTALYLGQLGLHCTLFEQEPSLISGPPFCHLHAGGNLYREISDTQCVTLLKQSIDFLRYYPFIIDYRPTVIAVPTTDSGSPEALLPRLQLLVSEYEALIAKDSRNKVLGDPQDYYKCYTKEAMEALRDKECLAHPQSLDEWMVPVAKEVDLEKVKFPLIIVQEYGLNLFRLASGVSMALEQIGNVTLHLQTHVTSIAYQNNRWHIGYEKAKKRYETVCDYLINAAGFRTGSIDNMVGVKEKRMVEFKAAYVSRWQEGKTHLFPEIIFHGERGTPQGMGQFTPYPGGHFQLHGMTEEITLYPNGLVASTPLSAQPKLDASFIRKIEQQWEWSEVDTRTKRAIRHIAQYMPDFQSAVTASKPLFGAQQIPGDDPTLRVAEVAFPANNYARCEIVKVSSALDMVDAIAKELAKGGWIDGNTIHSRDHHIIETLAETDIASKAEQIAASRGYPASMAGLNVTKY